MGGLLVGGSSMALAQGPPPPPAAPEGASPDQLADRLRKMEAMNQQLLEQFQGLSRQNQALTDTVKDLSQRLDQSAKAAAASPTGGAPTGGTPAGGGATASGAALDGSTGEITESGMTGGLTSPSESKKKDDSKDRVPLRAFNDLSYRQRYGFVLQSQDQEYEIRFNGLVQVDSRMYQQRGQVPVINDLDIPRARMWFSGRLTKPIEYQVAFQRSTNNFDILNAYLNFHYDDRLQFRIGRFRSPYTYEWTKLSIWEMPTPERSPFAVNFGPNRQVGFMAWGNTFENRLEYAAGLFGGARNSFQDFNSAKDVMAFVDYRPFLKSKTPLEFLSVGGSVDAGQQNNPLSPALLRGSVTASTNTLGSGSGDSIIAIPFLAFNNNVRERGDRTLWELHATYFYKALALLAAWETGNNDFALTTNGARPVHLPVSGYFVQASYMLTGETREKITLVDPKHPLDFRKGKRGFGAFEVQARVSEVAVGREVFTSGLSDPNLWSNRADFLDAGINWYLNKYVKFMFDWQHGVFAQPALYRPGPGLEKTSDLFWLRAQVYF